MVSYKSMIHTFANWLRPLQVRLITNKPIIVIENWNQNIEIDKVLIYGQLNTWKKCCCCMKRYGQYVVKFRSKFGFNYNGRYCWEHIPDTARLIVTLYYQGYA
jgi:hypothetical protein